MDLGAFFDQFFKYCVKHNRQDVADKTRKALEQLGRDEILVEDFMQIFEDAKKSLLGINIPPVVDPTPPPSRPVCLSPTFVSPMQRRRRMKSTTTPKTHPRATAREVPQKIKDLQQKYKCTKEAAEMIDCVYWHFMEQMSILCNRVTKENAYPTHIGTKRLKQLPDVRDELDVLAIAKAKNATTAVPLAQVHDTVSRMNSVTEILLSSSSSKKHRTKRKRVGSDVKDDAQKHSTEDPKESATKKICINELVLSKAIALGKQKKMDIFVNRKHCIGKWSTWKQAGLPLAKWENLQNY